MLSKSLEEVKSDISLLTQDIYTLDDISRTAALSHLNETIGLLRMGSATDDTAESLSPPKKIKLEEDDSLENSAASAVEWLINTDTFMDEVDSKIEEDAVKLENEIEQESVAEKLYNGVKPTCNLCGMVFINVGSLDAHCKNNHEDFQQQQQHLDHPKLQKDMEGHMSNIKCEICDVTFSRHANLRRHKERVNHKNKVRALMVSQEDIGSYSTELTPENKVYSDAHNNTYNTFMDMEASWDTENFQIASNYESSGNFNTDETLGYSHIETHSKEMQNNPDEYKCLKCEQPFNSSNNLEYHNKNPINCEKILKIRLKLRNRLLTSSNNLLLKSDEETLKRDLANNKNVKVDNEALDQFVQKTFHSAKHYSQTLTGSGEQLKYESDKLSLETNKEVSHSSLKTEVDQDSFHKWTRINEVNEKFAKVACAKDSSPSLDRSHSTDDSFMNQLESELNELESLLQSSAKDEANSVADKDKFTEEHSPMLVAHETSDNDDYNEPPEKDEHEVYGTTEQNKNLIQSILIELVMNVRLQCEQKAPSLDYENQKYNNKDTFRQHKNIHTDKKAELNRDVFECHQCGKTFTNRVSFGHHKNEHTDKYWCKTCDKRFSTNQKIKSHSCAWVLKNRKEALNNESTETIAVGINQIHKTSAVNAPENNISSLQQKYPGLSIVPKIRTT